MGYPLVTDERIESALNNLGLQTSRNDSGEIIVAFEDAEVVFLTEGAFTTVRSHWLRGTHEEASGHRMREMLNRINMAIPLGFTFTAATEWGATMVFRYHFLYPSGVSDAQLASMFDVYLATMYSIIEQLESSLPDITDGPLNTPEA